MNCKCQRYSNNVWIVDDKCIPLMHEKPARRYSRGGDLAVPAGSLFDLNIFVESNDGIIFDCGCEARFHPDGDPFFDIDTRCLLEYHPELAE